MIGRVGATAVVAFVAFGCGLTDVGQPLTARLVVSPAAPRAGELVELRVSGTGRFITTIAIEYGDGDEDSVEVAGSQSASHTFTRTYGSAGSYTAIGTIFDSRGILSDTVEIVIQPGS